MSKYSRRRTFKLDFLGKEWENCFIIFSSVSTKEYRDLMAKKIGQQEDEKIIEISVQFLKDHFIEGAAYNNETKEIEKMTIDDVEELDFLVQEKVINFLVQAET